MDPVHILMEWNVLLLPRVHMDLNSCPMDPVQLERYAAKALILEIDGQIDINMICLYFMLDNLLWELN